MSRIGAFAASGRSRWYVLLILCLLFAVSMVDRLILALLVQPLKQDLGVSDTQLGMLMGLAFAVLYSVAGFPIAQLIDRRSRKVILAIGVAGWSAATILSGFTTSFGTLFALRAGVAIGEAVLTPAAISLIADLFGPRERALPTSIYMAVAGVMGTGAFAIGGLALELAGSLTPLLEMAPWRITLMIVGAPGMFLALLLLFTVREPARGASAAPGESAQAQGAADYFRRTWRLFLPFFVASGILNIFTMGLVAWFPTYLARAFQVESAEAGYLFSLVGVPAGLIGSFLWPFLANRFETSGRRDAMPLLLAVSCGAIIPLAIALPFATSPWLAALLVGALIVIVSTNTTLPLLVVQAVGHSNMRGRLTALELLAYNLIGLASGPVIVAWLGQRFGSESHGLGFGLALTATIAGLVAGLLFIAARKPYLCEQARIAVATAPIPQEG